MLGFVLSLLIAFQGTATPDAGTALNDQLEASPVYAGQVALAAREYRASDETATDSGILYIQASVRIFDSGDEATTALSESVTANVESETYSDLEEQDDPGIGDESEVYSGELAGGGFVGLVFVVRDTALFRFIAASPTDDPLAELTGAVEGWFGILDELGEPGEPIDLLPGGNSVPNGFEITLEGSITTDGEARPATPAA